MQLIRQIIKFIFLLEYFKLYYIFIWTISKREGTSQGIAFLRAVV